MMFRNFTVATLAAILAWQRLRRRSRASRMSISITYRCTGRSRTAASPRSPGQFRQINKVEFVFDRSDVSKSSVKVEIEAASLDSNHFFRDNWARSEAELNVWKFRTITFQSTKIEKTGDNTGKMTGDLTMHGVTHPITMDVTYNKGGRHIRENYSIDGFTAQGKLKRTDFGMKAFIPWIGEEIEFVIQLEAKRPNDPS